MGFDPRQARVDTDLNVGSSIAPLPTDDTNNAVVTNAPSSVFEDTQSASYEGASDTQRQSNNISNHPSVPDKLLRFCTVCASNQNRSMEAHLRLASASYPCISFGTGTLVRLPGPSITQPNVYSFNTTSYRSMYDELAAKDPRLYRANGLLTMLERNLGLKWGPERWQDWAVGRPRLQQVQQGDKGALGIESGVVDIVITCEERCWEAVVDDLNNRGGIMNRPVHVINVDIKDNHEEALVAGGAILDLANRLEAVAQEEQEIKTSSGSSFDERVPDVIADWQEQWPKLPALWSLCWF